MSAEIMIAWIASYKVFDYQNKSINLKFITNQINSIFCHRFGANCVSITKCLCGLGFHPITD